MSARVIDEASITLPIAGRKLLAQKIADHSDLDPREEWRAYDLEANRVVDKEKTV